MLKVNCVIRLESNQRPPAPRQALYQQIIVTSIFISSDNPSLRVTWISNRQSRNSVEMKGKAGGAICLLGTVNNSTPATQTSPDGILYKQ